MRKIFLFLLGIIMSTLIDSASAQQKMTPELLWKLGRISPGILTPGGKVFYQVKRFDALKNEDKSNLYFISLHGGEAKALPDSTPFGRGLQVIKDGKIGYTVNDQFWVMEENGTDARQMTHSDKPLNNIRISPQGDYILFSRRVKLKKVYGKDFYPVLSKSNVQIYTDLMYRHWDQWFDGTFAHVFYATYDDSTGKMGTPVDIMKDQPYNCPQAPFGGAEDFIWSPDGQHILYVCKKKYGKENALSTNTDIYEYDLSTGKTNNLTEKMKGSDTQPAFSPDGKRLAWCSMSTDGYESDKNDLMVMDMDRKLALNLTGSWDGTVSNFRWSEDGTAIYFIAPVKGTMQLFTVEVPQNLLAKINPAVKQVTEGKFNVTEIVGQQGDTLILSRQDMNHATELFTYLIGDSSMETLTHVNDDIYDHLKLSKIESRWIKTTDDQEELVWIIYPPDFRSEERRVGKETRARRA